MSRCRVVRGDAMRGLKLLAETLFETVFYCAWIGGVVVLWYLFCW